MKLLALENSTTRGSIVFLEGKKDPIVSEFPNDRRHSGTFFRSLENLSACFRELDSIVIGLGPGSYAGIRIAIGAAIGLQKASGARLIGLPSVCALATEATEYCVVGDARRESFFFARIRANKIVQGFDLYDQAELSAQLKRLDLNMPFYCSEVLPQFEQVSICYPSALVLARLTQGDTIGFSQRPLEPIYLHPPHITIPKMAARIVS